MRERCLVRLNGLRFTLHERQGTMPESRRCAAILLMAMGEPDRLENVEPFLLSVQGGPFLLRFTSLSSAPIAMLNDSPDLIGTLASMLTAHESSISPTS